jgi:hypothetical protein
MGREAYNYYFYDVFIDTAIDIVSGKRLITIVTKESDSDYCLRLGPILLARGSLCILNEIGRISVEDQGFLLDVMILIIINLIQ